MNFEDSIVSSWGGWDNFGSDYYFYDCVLNPEFWSDHKDEFSAINAGIEKYGNPTVYYTLDDTGFICSIYFNTEDEDSPEWKYDLKITRA